VGDERSGEHCHRAGDIHVHIGERFDQRESNGDNHYTLTATMTGRHIHGNRHCNRAGRSAAITPLRAQAEHKARRMQAAQ